MLDINNLEDNKIEKQLKGEYNNEQKVASIVKSVKKIDSSGVIFEPF